MTARSGDMKKLLIELNNQEPYFHRLMCFDLVRLWLLAVCKQHILKWVCRLLNNPPSLPFATLMDLSCWDHESTSITLPQTPEERLNRLLCTLAELISRGLLKAELDLNNKSVSFRTANERDRFPNLKRRHQANYKASRW
jgi:hypothetical protein